MIHPFATTSQSKKKIIKMEFKKQTKLNPIPRMYKAPPHLSTRGWRAAGGGGAGHLLSSHRLLSNSDFSGRKSLLPSGQASRLPSGEAVIAGRDRSGPAPPLLG